jgi:tetratricopeptide (TPR) repeat protein
LGFSCSVFSAHFINCIVKSEFTAAELIPIRFRTVKEVPMARLVLVIGGLLILVRSVAGQQPFGPPPPVSSDSEPEKIQKVTFVPPPLPEKKTRQKVDKDKLRELALMPSVSAQFRFNFSDEDPEFEKKEKENETKRIAELEKDLEGNESDAERYYELASLYEDKEKNREVRAKAAELILKQIETDPKNAKLHVRYSALLEPNDPEAEKHAQEAIRLAPARWRYWINLGAIYAEQFYTPLAALGQVGRIQGKNPAVGWTGFLPRKSAPCLVVSQAQKTTDGNANEKEENPTASILDQPTELSPQQLQEMKGKLKKAWECYDKARELAPDKVDVYEVRINFQHSCCWHAVMLSEDSEKAINQYMKNLIDDCKQVARLCPDDPGSHARVPYFLFFAALARNPPEDFNAAKDLVETVSLYLKMLSPESVKEIHQAMDRLEVLAQGKDSVKVEKSCRYLSTLALVLGEWKKAEDFARRGLALNPSNNQYWDVLDSSVIAQKREEEHFKVCKDWVARIPTARTHRILARCYFKKDDFSSAEKVLREGLKKEPADINCQIALAATLIRRSNQADTLAEADLLLDQALRGIEQAENKEKLKDCYKDAIFNKGIVAGLKGDVSASWMYFEAMPKDDDQGKAARRLFSD